MIHGDMNSRTVSRLRRRVRRRVLDPELPGVSRVAIAVATAGSFPSRSELLLVVDLLRELVEAGLRVRDLAGFVLRQEVALLIRRVGADRRERRIEARVLVGEDV